MWLDRLDAAQTPREIAEALFEFDLDLMTRSAADAAGQDAASHLRRLGGVSDRVLVLVEGMSAFADRACADLEPDWWAQAGSGGDPYYPYDAAILAIGCLLSLQLRDAYRAGVDASQLLRSMSALDRMPDGFDPAADYESAEALVEAMRSYEAVPQLWGMRAAWFLMARRRATDGARSSIDFNGLMRRCIDRIGLGHSWRGARAALAAVALEHLLDEVDLTPPPPRSWLDFEDLPALARRHAPGTDTTAESLALRYQDRVVELFRSLGLPSVPAGTGEPLPDAYVELPDDVTTYLMVDAKSTTTAKGYNLPSDDRDAIARYVEKAPGHLGRGRSVRAVLIVGPMAADGLAAKLQTLSDRVRLPVRFTTADELVALRREHRAGAPLTKLGAAVTSGAPVLSEGWWRAAVADAAAEDARLIAFVKAGLRTS